jgi:hypothetical protein
MQDDGSYVCASNCGELEWKVSWFTCFQHINFFNPKYYPSDEEDYITMSEQWLKGLILKFGLMMVESDLRRAELLEFVQILRHGYENISFYEPLL